jgi:hypothetical protein
MVLNEELSVAGPLAALNSAEAALNDAIAKVQTDVADDGVPSRTGMAMLRDAADLVKRAVPEVGKLRRRQ